MPLVINELTEILLILIAVLVGMTALMAIGIRQMRIDQDRRVKAFIEQDEDHTS